jgi:pimeloyl-ACP methyl ester carboxylesterase
MSQLLCGKYSVYENRSVGSGRMISLNILVAPTTTPHPAPDPVFYLAGGPGQGAARIASNGEDPLMRDLRRVRDLIFIDQRGTGDSHQLQCNSGTDDSTAQRYFLDLFRPESIRTCREALSKVADLPNYTTPMALADLDEVRVALGYDKINLYGVSWGTLTALQYLSGHSKQVRAAALAGVSTPKTKLPLHFARGTQHAIDRLIEDCGGDEGCRAAFPKLKEEFLRVLHAFDGGPVQFAFIQPITKSTESVQLSRGAFVERLRLMLYDHRTAALIPLLIHHAAQNDWTVFAKVATRLAGASSFGIALGSYFTVTCSESVPTITEEEIDRETNGTFMGEYRTRRHQDACRQWPRAEITPEYYRPVESNVPVLMLSGELDPATPPEFGREAVKFLPNGRQVILRNTPHDYRSQCATNLIAEFIDIGSVQKLNTTCAERIRRPRFLTELPERYNR